MVFLNSIGSRMFNNPYLRFHEENNRKTSASKSLKMKINYCKNLAITFYCFVFFR